MSRRFFIPALALLALAACETNDEEEYVERPVDEIYNQAMDALEGERYNEAAHYFDEVERQHPYSAWATKAQLMAAYSSYQANKYEDAVAALDRFIQLHPSSPDAPYAYYLKALSYYEQISDVARDQEMTGKALRTLKELVSRYPNSKYARDAKLKLDLTYDHLAGKEMEIGRYYLKQAHYLAAINRFNIVVKEFQTTTHVPEALLRLVESYLALGIKLEAQKAAAVLGHNFPGSEWYIDAYEMVELKPFRPESEPPSWYEVWKGEYWGLDDGAREYRVEEKKIPMPGEKPWYKPF